MKQKVRSISVSAMRSRFAVSTVLILLVTLLMAGNADCKVLDRIVASIDDMAITESEFNERYDKLVKIDRDVDRRKALEAIVNRELLLRDAKKYRLEGDEDEVITQYIDLKFRALIRVNEKESRKYYDEHRDEFQGRKYDDVRDDIIKYLTEYEVNKKLKKQIEKLRRTATIRIMLDEEE